MTLIISKEGLQVEYQNGKHLPDFKQLQRNNTNCYIFLPRFFPVKDTKNVRRNI